MYNIVSLSLLLDLADIIIWKLLSLAVNSQASYFHAQ